MGIGISSLITITVSGFKFNFERRVNTVEYLLILISFILSFLEIFTLIINEIDTHIKKALIKLLSILI